MTQNTHLAARRRAAPFRLRRRPLGRNARRILSLADALHRHRRHSTPIASAQHAEAQAPLHGSFAPVSPAYDLRVGLASAGVSLVVGLSQGLGLQLVSANLPAVQGSLGAAPAEAAWLTTAYFAS